MAKEILRGVHKSRKSGDISLQRWVQKSTIEALKRLRGQGWRQHPTEGEVIDQAVAFFELHKKMACDALMPSGNGRRCQQWKSEHGDWHINFEVGMRWPKVELSVGENVGDGTFRGVKRSAEEESRRPSIFDDIYDRVAERVNTMQIAEDEVLHPNPSAEEPGVRISAGDFPTTPSGRVASLFCQHCKGLQDPADPNGGPCPKCFAEGHRNAPAACFICCVEITP